MKVLASEVRAQGRLLRANGGSDSDVLAELEKGRSAWLARGRALLDEKLASRTDGEPVAVSAESAG
jgi:hypothetical protein